MPKRRLTDEQRLENKRKNSQVQNKKNPYFAKDKQSKLWYAARRRAKNKKLPFNLKKEDITVPSKCPYLGIELLEHVARGKSRRQVASLDRVIPELGYVKDNVEVISHLANTMKNDATVEELVLFAKEILRRYDNPLLRRRN